MNVIYYSRYTLYALEKGDSLLDLKTKTIVISRDLTQKEKDYLESQKKHPRSNMIAVDAIALIVNNDNPIEILSISEIRDILTGKITKWSDIEPTKLGDIQVVFDDEGSSTVKYMRDSIMKGEPFDRTFSPSSQAARYSTRCRCAKAPSV